MFLGNQIRHRSSAFSRVGKGLACRISLPILHDAVITTFSNPEGAIPFSARPRLLSSR